MAETLPLMHDDMLSLSVCICTFRRPDLLRRLLTALLEQTYSADHFEVLVVDNDPERSALPVLESIQASFGDRLKVLQLAESNISLARNAAIQQAAYPWIVMIDDDELPQSQWLAALAGAQREYQADVVFAPVLPEYDPQVPAWIQRGGYFDRARMASGTPIDHRNARSGNVLMSRAVLLKIGGTDGPFSREYGRSGGEDSMLFRQLDMAGACMVWCDEAPVTEWVPADRACAMWLLKRSFRTGQLFMKTELATTVPSKKIIRALWLSLRAVLQMLIACLLVAVLGCFDPEKAFAWLRVAASQCGKLNHFFSRPPEVYGGTQGS